MRRNKALLGVVSVLAVCAVVAVIAGCPPKVEDPPLDPMMPDLVGADDAPVSGDPIKIGAIFSVTGHMAPLGEPEKMAVEMLQEQINAAGGVLGRPIEVIIKDDKSETTEAVMAAKDLIETEKVVAIIGPSGTPTTLAITDMCEQAGVPLISCAAGRPITDPIKPYVFAVPQTDTLAVTKIIDYLNANNIKSVATIYVANPFGESGQEQMEALFAAAGIEIVTSETFGSDDTDMTAQLTKIRGRNPEVVVCWGTNPGPANVAKGMAKLGMTQPLIQSHGVANRLFLELAGEAAEGVMLPAGRLIVWESIPDDHPQKAVLQEFAEAFKAEHGVEADTFAGHAYDALHILVKAIENANSTDSSAVRDAIEQTSGFIGTAGEFNYSANDHNGLTKDAFVWVKVENGDWVLAE